MHKKIEYKRELIDKCSKTPGVGFEPTRAKAHRLSRPAPFLARLSGNYYPG